MGAEVDAFAEGRGFVSLCRVGDAAHRELWWLRARRGHGEGVGKGIVREGMIWFLRLGVCFCVAFERASRFGYSI